MPSRHSRPSRWSTWKWQWPALGVSVVVVTLALAAAITGAPQQKPLNSAAGPHATRSSSSRASGPMTLPPPAQGNSASPQPTKATTTSCPAPTGKATLTVGAGGRYSTIQAAVDAAGAGDTVEIAGGTYHETVNITKGGSAGAYLTVRAKAGETVTIDGGNSLPTSSSAQGLVTLGGQRYVRLSGLTIVNSHQHGIYAGHASNLIIENNKVSHTQDGGIFVGDGSSVQVICNRVDHANSAASGGNIDAAANEAISLFNVSDFTIKGNNVSENFEEGIDVKNGTRDGTVQNNVSYRNSGPNIYADGASDVNIFANRVYGAKGSSKAGITLGVESGGNASNVKIYNNVIYQNAGGGIDLWIGHYSNVQIFYNTIYSNGQPAIRATDGVVSDSIARDNIAYDNSLTSVPGFSLSGNVTSNPLFVNQATNDVRLKSGSPALNRGSAAGAPTTDFAGRSRPIGAGPDIGAYESG
jgi:parallel beta-helix repeat protein